MTGRCRDPPRRCCQPDHRDQGANLRLTFRRDGKAVTESMPDGASREMSYETDEFRRWPQLGREYAEVDIHPSQARPVAGTLDPRDEDGPGDSGRRDASSMAAAAGGIWCTRQDPGGRSGSSRTDSRATLH